MAGTELEDLNPAFIAWAVKNGIELKFSGDWACWFDCWVDGYTHGVDNVKKIIRGHAMKEEEVVPTHWDCCGIRHPIHRRCQCGETVD